MTLCDRLLIRSLSDKIIRFLLIIPYLIIASFIILLVLLVYSKYFPSLSEDVINTFGSAILGTVIGGVISLYLTISTRKKDSTDSYLYQKKANIYIPFYKEFLTIVDSIKIYNFCNYSIYSSKFWIEINKNELHLDVPKHILKWIKEYNSCIDEYKKAMISFELLCSTNKLLFKIADVENLQSINPLIAYTQDFFLKNENYISEHSDSYRIGTKENILVHEDKKDEILDKLKKNISESDEYFILKTQKVILDKKANELYELFQYIIKLINSRNFTSIEYI